MNLSVLLVEDDADLCHELAVGLSRAGFRVGCAGTLQAAEAALAAPVDLMVLDINLPDGSGLDFCRRQRPGRHTGIVICTARNERDLRIASLLDGADAYLVKPVDLEELAATLLSVYRRMHPPSADSLLPLPRRHSWRLDCVQRVLTAPNAVGVLLSAAELIVIDALFRAERRFASRDELIACFAEPADAGSAHRLEALISRLRRKVIDKTGLKLPLVSAYGRGYEFAAHVQRIE